MLLKHISIFKDTKIVILFIKHNKYQETNSKKLILNIFLVI